MSPPAAPDLGDPERFQALWRRCLIEGARDDSAAVHRRLLDGYGEPGRYYHTLEHIEHCIGWFDQCASLVDDPDALELAVWFHDVVYESGNPDNEVLSAKLYLQLADDVHDPARRDLVYRMIMATLHLGSSLKDDDARYMVDIDLSSFGLPWQAFLRDSENLRREAGEPDDETYFRKARKFHQSLLARKRFYYTDFFAERLESRARDNIRRYLEFIGD